MSTYDRALTAARDRSPSPPSFEAIVEAAARDRQAFADEDEGARARARWWMVAAAASWLIMPLRDVLTSMESLGLAMVMIASLPVIVASLAPLLSCLWGARLCGQRRLRSAILVRGIAASNLVVALLYAISVGGDFGAAFAVALALSSGRALLLLGERGLEPGADQDTEFVPVRFRGVLIVALVMAFADGLTLLYSAALAGSWTLVFTVSGFAVPEAISAFALTTGAAALMAVNVWGLLRLRTWALFTNMISNLAIAALALAGLLVTNPSVSVALAVTAAVQLLLPVPILAAALGDREAGRSHARVGALLTRVLVPALVLATLVTALANFDDEYGYANEWTNERQLFRPQQR